ncbi:hypothetical protein [Streptomyces sp. NPDC056296]|uniref:hypothetical protein n=1 Tax=Streptomyces sp. NPDC056296 TaxID=3345775 RepID=UPI0035DE722E
MVVTVSRSTVPSPLPLPLPLPLGTDAPPTCEVPHFAPVRVRGGGHLLHRLVRHRRRAVAAGLAVTAAALVAAGPHPGVDAQDTQRARGHPVTEPERQTEPERERARARAREAAGSRHGARLVTAPVRIADAATVRLLGPGDRVDVVAAGDGGADDASVIARGALVAEVPEPMDGTAAGGALVVVSVPRATAHRLVGASALSRLAVTLC